VAIQTLLNHIKHKGQHYYVANLTEEGYEHLFIAYHVHDTTIVSRSGEPLNTIAVKYVGDKQAEFRECMQKVQSIKNAIDTEFRQTGQFFQELKMPLVSDCPDLAVSGHYEKRDDPKSLYVGGYHRFVAYGVWVLENGFQPLRLFYCEVSGAAR
jgi:hypothetical protein